MKTGILIKELRTQKGLTQEELAAKTELSTRTIQRIENGEVDPRSYTLQMIANALEVDFSLFLEDESLEKENENDKLILGLIHLSALFLLFVPSILIWHYKKDKVKDITDHFNYVIRFQLTLWLLFILPGLFIYFFLGANNFINKAPSLVILGLIFSFFYSIINTVNVVNGKPYRRFSVFK